MRIDQILKDKEFTLSVELLAPKGGFDIEQLRTQVEYYSRLDIDFYSMTMAAGGRRERKGTISLAHRVMDWTGKECIAHLTCLNSYKDDIEEKIVDLHHLGIENILALRGDLPDSARLNGECARQTGDFTYASDLISYLSGLNRFCIGAAAYPAGYPSDHDVNLAVHRLKQKQDAGADFTITQMLFEVSNYATFVGKCREAGVTIPIIPGVYMLNSYHSCQYIKQPMFGITVPQGLENALNVGSKSAACNAGLDYAIDLCRKLKSNGAPGVHLYMLSNNEYSLELLRKARNS